MQHGTGREAALELVENVEATLVRWGGKPYRDIIRSLRQAIKILKDAEDLDEPGVYGPNYPSAPDYHSRSVVDVPRVTQAERDEAIQFRSSPAVTGWAYDEELS